MTQQKIFHIKFWIALLILTVPLSVWGASQYTVSVNPSSAGTSSASFADKHAYVYLSETATVKVSFQCGLDTDEQANLICYLPAGCTITIERASDGAGSRWQWDCHTIKSGAANAYISDGSNQWTWGEGSTRITQKNAKYLVLEIPTKSIDEDASSDYYGFMSGGQGGGTTGYGFYSYPIYYFIYAIIYGYNLQYVANGIVVGSTGTKWRYYNQTTLPKPDIIPESTSRPGYILAGWNTGEEKYYSHTETPSVSDIFTLNNPNYRTQSANNIKTFNIYAQWAPKTYTISFDNNGGTGDSSPQSYYVDESFSLRTPTRAGYVFKGWKVISGTEGWASKVGTTITNVGLGNYGDVSLQAQWQLIEYSISFNGNGSTSGSMSNMTGLIYGNDVTLTSNTFVRQYNVTYDANGGTCSTSSQISTYQFNVWGNSATSPTTTYLNGATVKNLTTENDATVPLYAQWTPQSVTLPTPTRTGYVFNGWYTQEKGGTKIGDGGASYTPTADMTLHAQWTEFDKGNLTVTVTGLKNDDSAVCTVVSSVDGSRYVLSLTAAKNSDTIKDVYVGEYTVSTGGWQWNYTLSGTSSRSATLTKGATSNVTFNLSTKADTPKYDSHYIENILK